ncbi:4-hydroxy-tetrahydrodipicolinate reductase [Chromatiales bacterium (ex Bugula neritina AB1)]|nr:4-hydroxy-tetrahydrodipicolinate reductase [Chromatiales bacterium (ex Bugula neritina AB1)]
MSGLAVAGAAGRMGRQLIRAILERDDVRFCGATEHPKSELVGTDAGLLVGSASLGVTVTADIALVDDSAETIIDFTSPENTRRILRYAAENKKKLVIGTTGLNDEDKQLMRQAAEQTAIVFASNYSVGVTLSLELLAMAASVLGPDYDVEVIEAHHRHKVDAPSGTALSMGEAVALGQNKNLNDHAVYAREGITGARPDGAIGFATIRAGDIIGEHTVMFCGQGERLEITHKATDRMTFARGAIRAALWVSQQSPGLYNMADVLKPGRS